jgi:hypothetical protein
MRLQKPEQAPTPEGYVGRKIGMMRFRVEARDVPPEKAALRLGMTPAKFNQRLPNLLARGFPAPDPDTGNFDLVAIDRWCDARHVHLFGPGSEMQARDARDVARDRIDKL